MLSFSTCWNSRRHTDGAAMIEEILDLGFRGIELSHGLFLSLTPGIHELFQEGRFKVSSVHNFFPQPLEVLADAPDCYEFTSHRPNQRERAVKLTLKTIDFARKFKAPLVVLHMGSVPLLRFTRRLRGLVRKGELHSREYVDLKLKAIRKREKAAPLYLERAADALSRLAGYAEEHDVRLGVESRSCYEEVPTEDEMIKLLDEVDSSHVGYWHDFGHVQLRENLGFVNHEEWLRRMRPRLFGCHVHDVVWPSRDHRPPLSGMIDYDKLLPIVPPECPLIWEISPRQKKSAVKKAVEEWRERYGDD